MELLSPRREAVSLFSAAPKKIGQLTARIPLSGHQSFMKLRGPPETRAAEERMKREAGDGKETGPGLLPCAGQLALHHLRFLVAGEVADA